MKLTLLRHGMTIGNALKLYYGSTDIPLTDRGVEELKELNAKYIYPRASRYFTSGMIRTEQTFAALYGDIPHEVLRGLREIDFGEFEMRTYEQLRNDPKYIEWINGDNEANICPGGESGIEVTKRALDALEPLIHGSDDCVCITHGGVIGGIMGSWFASTLGRYEFTPEPGMGFQIEFKDGKPVSYKKTPELSREILE